MPIRVELFVKNGNLVTMEPSMPVAEAMVISGNQILAIGTSEELASIGKLARKSIDLKGRTVIPGFIDSHAHLAGLGVRLLKLDLGNAKSAEDALTVVQEAVAQAPIGDLVIGYNWDESQWVTPRFLTRMDLDPISPQHPVVLIRICGHLVSVNSLALQQLKIDLSQEGVDKDSQTGEPTGVLREVSINPGQLQSQEGIAAKALIRACQYANSVGITSVHENLNRRQLPFVSTYLKLKQSRELTVRVYVNLEAKMIDLLAGLGLSSGFGDSLFRLGGVKVFIDGSLGAQTAALSSPYKDKPESKGMLLYSEEDFSFLLETANSLGQQVNTHAIGDRGIEFVLRCLEKTNKNNQIQTLRHSIIHAEYLTDNLLDQVNRLGVLLLMQPNFVHRWGLPGGMYDARVGPTRAQQLNAFQRILEADIRIGFGSDGMPMDPIYGLYSATTHPNPNIRISIEDALRCYTIDSAYASFEEKIKGSLAPGKLADFVILSEDIMHIPPEDLRKVTVLQTYLGGNLVYSHG
jgi:predicted amidohydrolase YtcJ